MHISSYKWKIQPILLRVLFIVLRSSVLLGCSFLLLTSVLWLSPIFAFWFLGLAFVAATATSKQCKQRSVFVVASLLLVGYSLALLVFWKIPYRQIDSRMNVLHQKALNTGPNSYTTVDCMAVYLGNIVMGLGGYAAGFTEVAWETWRLTLPGEGKYTINSDFAMKSKTVRSAISTFVDSLPQQGDEVQLETQKIAWGRNYSIYNHAEARVALALDCPLYLSAKAKKTGNRWRLEMEGKCRIEYPRLKSLTPVLGPLRVSETMFWALQRRGWLFPYTLTYKWSVYSDDPRLK
jgi:hypothetical protein